MRIDGTASVRLETFHVKCGHHVVRSYLADYQQEYHARHQKVHGNICGRNNDAYGSQHDEVQIKRHKRKVLVNRTEIFREPIQYSSQRIDLERLYRRTNETIENFFMQVPGCSH